MGAVYCNDIEQLDSEKSTPAAANGLMIGIAVSY